MESLWNDADAAACGDDPVALRVYTSRLIGREPALVLHGGGNTSVKAEVENAFGEREEILFVKGSGWDLATIERAGFAPVRLDVLRRMATLERLSDADMVRMQRAAMIDPSAPNPSVEAILHAIVPYRFVDHTHADAVVTITNTPGGVERLGEIYGERIFIVPYVMPGFELARRVWEMTRDIDWAQIEGMVLLNHGVLTFGDDARSSYERMIQIVDGAERWLDAHAPLEPAPGPAGEPDLRTLARLRRAVCEHAGRAMIARVDVSPFARRFSERSDAAALVSRGPLTPDHVIRTKRTAMVLGDSPERGVERYAEAYRAWFDRHTDGTLTCLDPAPRWVLWPGVGTVALGPDDRAAGIVADIVAHTLPAMARAAALGGWDVLDEDDLFDVEYWELEQAKLTRAGEPPVHAGRVALVTGAASGIGRACVERLRADGAVVAALDVAPEVERAFAGDSGVLARVCDVTDAGAVEAAVAATVERFGGLDVVVSNAGVFPASAPITEIGEDAWRRSLAVNLDAHRIVVQKCAPFLELGIDPAIVVVGSKNVPAPGPGAAAYSVAKAGLVQLCRVAALELAGRGIRVNVIHPNDVFDTGIWSEDVIAERAARYGLTPEEYRTRNLLGVEITSANVAAMASAMAGPLFACTTGAQIPVDGGNERVI